MEQSEVECKVPSTLWQDGNFWGNSEVAFFDLTRVVLERFKKCMVERHVPVRSMMLFGSRARGHHDPNSANDVFVAVQ